MKRTIHFICLLALPLLALAGEPPTFCESFGSGDNDSHTYCWVLSGYRSDKVAFVIFQNTHGTNTDYSKHIHLTIHNLKISAVSNANVCDGWIDMPDGTKRDLPTSNMVFEYTDGVFHSAPIEMSQADLSRFIDSGSSTNSWGPFQGLTVDNLKTFEKKIKAKSSNKTLEPTATAPSVSTNK
jgi:hypothetical protein